MIISCIWVGLAGGLLASTLHYRKKWKDLNGHYCKLKQDLTNALGEVGRVKLNNESIREANKYLAEHNRDYIHLINSGGRNLKVLERTLPMLPNIPQGVVVVAGVDTRRSDLYFPIKTILYDITDPSDREFAIREAEELIETIQKA